MANIAQTVNVLQAMILTDGQEAASLMSIIGKMVLDLEKDANGWSTHIGAAL